MNLRWLDIFHGRAGGRIHMLETKAHMETRLRAAVTVGILRGWDLVRPFEQISLETRIDDEGPVTWYRFARGETEMMKVFLSMTQFFGS